MEPRIQYAKTSDGVNIAYWTLGEGTPLVFMPPLLWSHRQMELQNEAWGSMYERLAVKRRLVLYDGRGSGLSDRDLDDFSMDRLMLDLGAVVDQLKVERFALFAANRAGPVAIAYAARFPERVAHLILWSTHAARRDYTTTPQLQATRSLANTDWDLFTETYSHVALGWERGELARWFAAYIREAVTRETLEAYDSSAADYDSNHLLSQVRSQTLVIHRRGVPAPSMNLARQLASGIPNARMALLEGDSVAPFVGDMESVVQAVDEFLSEGVELAALAHPEPVEGPSGTAVILFADIADSTALTERLGDAAFRAKAREIGVSLRALIRECGGAPVEGPTLGDGVLAAFTSAREAIEAAVRCRDEGSHAGLPLHVGVHAGDVMREKDPDGRANVYGGAVNIAARIAGVSAAGEILVSDIVRGLARTSAGVGFEDRGEHALKGVADPQRLFVVRTRESEA